MTRRNSTRTSGKTVILAGVCALALNGCAWLKDWPPGGATTDDAATLQPQSKLVQTPDATWIEPNAGGPATEKMVPDDHGARASLDQRMGDLEDKVAAMNQTMGSVMPALDRLATAQAGMQQMMTQLKTAPLSSGSAAAPKPEKQAMAAPPQEMEQESEQPPTPLLASRDSAPAASGAAVTAVRFGEHNGQTRIVLDCSDTVAFSNKMSDDKKSLTVTLKGAGWTGGKGAKTKASSLVASYDTAPDGQSGSTMTILLKQPGRVVNTLSLPPSEGKGPRIVIDIAKS